MPFTPLHLGPALAVGLPLRRHLHVPTFILANVVLDVEPLGVMIFGLHYPLHGYVHTFLSAVAVGLLLGSVMFLIEAPLQPVYRTIKLETDKTLKLKSFLIAGVFGTSLHVLFDALIYPEIQPFFPLSANPLLALDVSMYSVYLWCVLLGVFGLIYYGILFVRSPVKANR
ncbi:MAG: hydrolase [Candidatus Bathyarchaeota archaeon]|nr:hydrolase [Candidatus Bathyarchaeota archaeon]